MLVSAQSRDAALRCVSFEIAHGVSGGVVFVVERAGASSRYLCRHCVSVVSPGSTPLSTAMAAPRDRPLHFSEVVGAVTGALVEALDADRPCDAGPALARFCTEYTASGALHGIDAARLAHRVAVITEARSPAVHELQERVTAAVLAWRATFDAVIAETPYARRVLRTGCRGRDVLAEHVLERSAANDLIAGSGRLVVAGERVQWCVN